MYSADGDYSSITPDDNQYGIDIKVQEATLSLDWDIAAVTGGSGSSGGGGYVDHTLNAHTDVDVPSPSNGERLSFDGVNWIAKQSTSALGIAEFNYQMDLPLDTTPVSGDISRDADPNTVTTLYVHQEDSGGNDRSLFFQSMKTGDWINLHQQADVDNFESYDLTGPPVLNGIIWEFPVTTYSVGGAPLSNNDNISLFWRNLATTGPSGVGNYSAIAKSADFAIAKADATHNPLYYIDNSANAVIVTIPDLATSVHSTGDVVSFISKSNAFPVTFVASGGYVLQAPEGKSLQIREAYSIASVTLLDIGVFYGDLA